MNASNGNLQNMTALNTYKFLLKLLNIKRP